jgi:hypothetical protein
VFSVASPTQTDTQPPPLGNLTNQSFPFANTLAGGGNYQQPLQQYPKPDEYQLIHFGAHSEQTSQLPPVDYNQLQFQQQQSFAGGYPSSSKNTPAVTKKQQRKSSSSSKNSSKKRKSSSKKRKSSSEPDNSRPPTDANLFAGYRQSRANRQLSKSPSSDSSSIANDINTMGKNNQRQPRVQPARGPKLTEKDAEELETLRELAQQHNWTKSNGEASPSNKSKALPTNIKSLPKGGYTKDSVVSATVELFRNCKFIDSKDQLELTICKKVMELLGLDHKDSHEVRDFGIDCSKLINKTITDKRNYVQSRTKEAAFAWMADHNGTLPSVQQLKDCALRKINLEDPVDKEVFKWYWTVLLVDAHPTNEWSNVMMISYPSKAKTEEDNLIITSASEALAVLMIDNNRDKWLAMYKYLHTDKKGDKIPKRSKDNKEDEGLKALCNAKYTVQDGGQKPFGGWIKEGKQEFVKLKNDIKKAKK